MDSKEITEVLKTEGLDVAEDMALAATKAALKLLRALMPKVSAGFGLAFNLFLDAYEPQILALIDKIDGIDDPNY